jgi:hypothetical protein
MIGKWLEHAGKWMEKWWKQSMFLVNSWKHVGKTCGLFWKNAGSIVICRGT